MKRALCALAAVAAIAGTGAASASAAITPNPWLTNRFLNIAHQGGELEAPSNTMYAFKSAVAERGADELELDVNLSSDGTLMVIHNGSVDATTEGTGNVRDKTVAQLQALDAGYDFQWRTGQYSHNPNREYPFRGVRTGAVPPPAGYTADDFRIPTMREVLDTFPSTPINIEIKVPTDPEGIRIAEALAALLNEPKYASRRDIVVVSFKQPPLVRFHELAPNVYLAPSEDALLLFASNQPLDPDPVIFEVPTTYNLMGTEIDVPGLLLDGKQAHANGYAVDVFLDADEETDDVYAKLIGQGVDGIMSGAPGRLANYLCRADVHRPDGAKRCASQTEPPNPCVATGSVSRRLECVPDKLEHGFTLNRIGIRGALRRGLPVKATCTLTCRVRFQILITRRTAKRAGLKPRLGRPKIVGQGVVDLAGPSGKGFRLRFRTGVRSRLAKLGAIRVTIRATVLSSAGSADGQVTHTLRLTRPKHR